MSILSMDTGTLSTASLTAEMVAMMVLHVENVLPRPFQHSGTQYLK